MNECAGCGATVSAVLWRFHGECPYCGATEKATSELIKKE